MMETEKGGHYVNKGPLEYRQIGFDDSISGTSSSRINDDECKWKWKYRNKTLS